MKSNKLIAVCAIVMSVASLGIADVACTMEDKTNATPGEGEQVANLEYAGGQYKGGVDAKGKPHGNGTLTFSGGTVFELHSDHGLFRSVNKRTKATPGVGEQVENLGYEGGQYKGGVDGNGTPNGDGTLTYSSGTVFEPHSDHGLFRSVNKRTKATPGVGEQVENLGYEGGQYTGGVDGNGKPDGDGTLTYSSGTVFELHSDDGVFRTVKDVTFANGDATGTSTKSEDMSDGASMKGDEKG
ncbi:hypothetical protein FACS189449_03740 [Alphaproteobacteria bacterium]|nr:hypothetical protein FACS189449_03740 [Alphaproteobacteria bacterium]